MLYAIVLVLIGLECYAEAVTASDCASYYTTLTCSTGTTAYLNVTAEELYACTYNEAVGSTDYSMSNAPECTIQCTSGAQLVAYVADLSTQFFLDSARYDTTQWILEQTGGTTDVEWASNNIEFTCIGAVITCIPYTDGDGVTHTSRCNIYDGNATCNGEDANPPCTCTAGWSGTYCDTTDSAYALVSELVGANSTNDFLALLDEARTSPAALIDVLPSIFATLSQSERELMGWSLDEMIDSIDYERDVVDLEERMTFTYDPNMGNCYIFNFANESGGGQLNARVPGQNRDFVVRVILNASEQAPYIESLAIQVYIHAPGTPFLNGILYSLKAGASDIISLQKSITNMTEDCIDGVADLPHGQNYYMTGSYTVDNCYDSCYQDVAYATCGCMDAKFTHPTTIPDCLYNKTSCLDQVQTAMGDMSTWNCTCPQPCYQETYGIEATRATLPFKIAACNNDTAGCADMNQGIARLRVYLETLEIQQYVEVEKVTLSTCLSQIGGQMGLLLGMSIVGIIEIFLLCCQLVSGKEEEPKPPPRRRRQ